MHYFDRYFKSEKNLQVGKWCSDGHFITPPGNVIYTPHPLGDAVILMANMDKIYKATFGRHEKTTNSLWPFRG